jgi:hypothetical protein
VGCGDGEGVFGGIRRGAAGVKVVGEGVVLVGC